LRAVKHGQGDRGEAPLVSSLPRKNRGAKKKMDNVGQKTMPENGLWRRKKPRFIKRAMESRKRRQAAYSAQGKACLDLAKKKTMEEKGEGGHSCAR